MFVMPDQPPPHHVVAAAIAPAQAARAELPSAMPARAATNAAPQSMVPAGTPSASSSRPVARSATDAKNSAHTRLDVTSHGYRYLVVGNTLLAPVALRAALEAGDDPKAAISSLKKAYEAHGYFLVALVGQLRGREVWLQVVEGRLTHVEGPGALVAFFDGLKGDSKIQNSDVIRRSTLAQAYAATNGKQPQISFKAAPEVGGSTMHISETPLPNAHAVGGSLTTGNFGNRYAGHYLAQAQAYVQHDGLTLQVNHSRALTGMDENTRGAFYAATGANLSAITPLGTFQLDDNATRYELGEKFARLSPAGTIKRFGASANQLLFADDAHRWSLSEGLHHIRDTGTVFHGAYTLRDQKYFVWNLDSDYSMRFGGLFQQPASLSLSGGIKLGGARGKSGFDHQLGNPVGHFQVYTAGADLTQALPHGYSVQFSLSGQTSPDILPSYQQWVLGGVNNLTAYLPGTIVGDRGYLGRVTVQAPQWDVGPLRLRPNIFAEHGAARYSFITRGSPTWQSLDDVGASLNLSLPVAHTSAILAYAKPLGASHVARALRRGQQAHVFFYLQVAF